MTPDPLPPENASPEELRAYYRAVADAALAAVLAGLALPSRKPAPPMTPQSEQPP